MTALNYVGRDAASRKYDLLACIGAHGMATGQDRRSLRLITLITARYNWRRDELGIGQREIARLWNVTERTVKREMAAFRALGWIEVKRQGARGRVTVYRLAHARILAATQEVWPALGPDFEARLAPAPEEPAPDNVVRITFGERIEDGTGWGEVLARLADRDPARFHNWYANLAFEDVDAGTLRLIAPSHFVARYVSAHLAEVILHAARPQFGPLRALHVEAASADG